MSRLSNKKGIWVGVFIVVGLAFLLGGVLTIGNLRSTFQKKMTVSSIFDNVNGLQSGNNIWFSGVKIGTVKEITFWGNSQVKVVLNINKDSQRYIHKDSKVKISTDGLIGNKIIVIYGGDPQTPQVEEGDILNNESALSTDEIMVTLQENNLNILELTKQLASGEGTIGKLIKSDSLYYSILSTAQSFQSASEKAKLLIASLQDFSQNLNQEGTLLDDFLNDTVTFNSIQASVFELEHVVGNMNDFVTELKTAGKNPNSPVGVLLYDENSGTHLKKTIKNLDNSSETLNEDLEALKHNFLFRKYFKKKDKAAKKAKKDKE